MDNLRETSWVYTGKASGACSLYDDTYNKKRKDYWQVLEQEVAAFAQAEGYPYRINDLPYGRSQKGKPVIVNYFYHEKIRLKK